MNTELWQGYLQQACQENLNLRVFAAFNTNVDVVAHITSEKIQRLLQDNPDIDMQAVQNRSVEDVGVIRSKEDFLVVLRDMMQEGKSFHIVLEGRELMNWLDKQFAGESERMGGQAGIIANQMAALGAEAIAYTALLSPKQSSLFDDRVKTPLIDDGFGLAPIREAARPEDETKINWIFEYGKGIEVDFGVAKVVTPRANRVIVATRPAGAVMSFQEPVVEYLPELGASSEVAFMAGYHYVDTTNPDGRSYEEFMQDTVDHLRALKSKNPALKLHYEYVPMKYAEMEPETLLRVASEIKCFGINENEIRRVLTEFGFEAEAQAIAEDERAYSLYQGGLRLLEKMQVERVQVHNLGYYVLLLRKDYPIAPEKVRQACLFASAVNAMKARYGGYPGPSQLEEAKDIQLSDIGYTQLKGFAKEMAEKHGLDAQQLMETGYAVMEDHIVMVVPAHVIPDPVSTVGMGDTISSSSYAMEVQLGKE